MLALVLQPGTALLLLLGFLLLLLCLDGASDDLAYNADGDVAILAVTGDGVTAKPNELTARMSANAFNDMDGFISHLPNPNVVWFN